MSTDTTTFAFTRPSVNDDGPGWATQMNACIQEIDTALAVEHDADGTHGAITPTSIVCAGDITLGTDDDFIKGTTAIDGYVRCDVDGDGDFDPRWAATWAPMEAADGAGTINWNSTFSVPAIARAVDLCVIIQDGNQSTRSQSALFRMKAKSTGSIWTFNVYGPAQAYPEPGWGNYVEHRGVVPISAAGTSYYSIAGSGVLGGLTVYIYVVGYFL